MARFFFNAGSKCLLCMCSQPTPPHFNSAGPSVQASHAGALRCSHLSDVVLSTGRIPVSFATGKAVLLLNHHPNPRRLQAPSLLAPLWAVVEASAGALPMAHLLPTHVSLRGPALLRDAERWVRQGGNVDFTADQVRPRRKKVSRGVPLGTRSGSLL